MATETVPTANRPAPPSLPPIFTWVGIDAADPVHHARTLAEAEQAGAGTLIWARRSDRLDCAVVLEPDRPLAEALPAAHVALLALGDTLAAFGPPKVEIRFGWPDRLEVNGALAGGVRVAAPTGSTAATVPDWLVVGAAVDILGDPDDPAPGRHPERTALREEGFDLDTVTSADLLAAYGRCLLRWIDRWLADGPDAVRGNVLAGLHHHPPAMPVKDWDTGVLLNGPSWTLPQRNHGTC